MSRNINGNAGNSTDAESITGFPVDLTGISNGESLTYNNGEIVAGGSSTTAVNTCANIGSGTGIFSNLTTVSGVTTAKFKSIQNTDGTLSISNTSTDITINGNPAYTSNIYNSNGTLQGARTVTFAGNNLNLGSSTSDTGNLQVNVPLITQGITAGGAISTANLNAPGTGITSNAQQLILGNSSTNGAALVLRPNSGDTQLRFVVRNSNSAWDFITNDTDTSFVIQPELSAVGHDFRINLYGNSNLAITGGLTASAAAFFYGSLNAAAAFYDGNNTAGTSGQILSSTGTKTAWVTPASTNVGATAVAFGSGSGITGNAAALSWNDSTKLLTAGTTTAISTNGGEAILSKGTLRILNGVNDYFRFISAIDSSMTANSNRYFTCGQANSVNNLAQLGFNFQASGSTANYLILGLYANDCMYLSGVKNTLLKPTQFQSTLLDTSAGAGTSGQVLTSTGTGVAWSTTSTTVNLGLNQIGFGNSSTGAITSDPYFIWSSSAKTLGLTNVNSSIPATGSISLLSNGTIAILNGANDKSRFISAMDNAMGGGSSRSIAFGQASSNGNQAELQFNYSSSGSISNNLQLNIAGTNGLNISSATISANLPFWCKGSFIDSVGAFGSTGQVLTNAASGPVWTNPSLQVCFNSAGNMNSGRYFLVGNGMTPNQTDSGFMTGRAMTITSMNCGILTAPGTGRSWTFTIFKNSTSFTSVSIANAATANIISFTLTCAANDFIQVQVLGTSNPIGTTGFVTLQYY